MASNSLARRGQTRSSWRRLGGLCLLLAATQCALPRYRYADDEGASGGMAGADTDGSGGNSTDGGTGGSESGTGGGNGSGGATIGDPCTPEGALSCVTNASRNRFVCEDGELVAGTACSDDDLCDTESDNGECKPIVEECLGRAAGVPFCEGAVRKVCGPDLVSISSTTCESIQHCTQSTTDVCAFCLDGDFECDGDDLLLTCNDDNTDFDETECTDEPCSPTAGACTVNECLPGQGQCTGDVLRTCNDELTAFENPQTCDPGLCDQVGAQCDVCVPGSGPTCEDDDTLIDCSEDGQMIIPTECEGELPFCGVGACRECLVDNNCPTSGECSPADCDGSYTCSEVPLSTGRCDLTGNDDGYCSAGVCVGCLDSDDCNPPGEKCEAGACIANPPFTLGFNDDAAFTTVPSIGVGTTYAFRLPERDDDVTVLALGINGKSNLNNAQAYLAVYEGSGSPTALVMSAGVAVTSGALTEVPIPAPGKSVVLAAGTEYWIAVMFNAVPDLAYGANAAALGRRRTGGTWPNLPNPFNANQTQNGEDWPLFATVQDVP